MHLIVVVVVVLNTSRYLLKLVKLSLELLPRTLLLLQLILKLRYERLARQFGGLGHCRHAFHLRYARHHLVSSLVLLLVVAHRLCLNILILLMFMLIYILISLLLLLSIVLILLLEHLTHFLELLLIELVDHLKNLLPVHLCLV